MSYRVVVLHAGGHVAASFLALLEDGPWRVQELDCRQAVLPEFDRLHVSAVLDLVDEPPLQGCYDSALSSLVGLSAELACPLLQLGSYRIAGESFQGEFNESLSARDVEASFWSERELKVCSLVKHIRLRCSWMLDAGDEALLALMVPRLLSGDQGLLVSDHHFGAPLSSAYVAGVLQALLQQIFCGAENWGVFNLHSADTCSEAEFCDHLLRQLSKELDRPFDLPAVAGVDDERVLLRGEAALQGRRITDDFGIQLPTWRRGFGRLLRAWMQDRALIPVIEVQVSG
ncbi:sugar nucleotide-binding protein [Agaribacterium haliotis]|uniref:sugar nucleotide-binding protein n=1 Tax=Agaribacterium haliotis TaxID=2013869 RepID=UPI001177623A|nr:sugar nucleotide-binding protein [Agaribacterium haliotis]